MHLKEHMSVFEMEFEGWRKAAQKAGRWFRRVEEGGELFMRKWHEVERRRAAERHAKAAATPSTVGISRREPSCSRGNGMRRRDAELQSDTQRPRQRHPPSASLNGRGGGGRGGRLAQETDVLVWP